MKTWLRRLLIAALLVVLTLGILYDCATHVGRGWLFGEAFYDGRPTSYWRYRIDSWVARFESPEAAEKSMRHFRMRLWRAGAGDAIWIDGPVTVEGDTLWVMAALIEQEPTIWQRVRNVFKLERDDDRETPKVLNGASDAEPVLHELEADAYYRLFTDRARRNAEGAKRHVTIRPAPNEDATP